MVLYPPCHSEERSDEEPAVRRASALPIATSEPT